MWCGGYPVLGGNGDECDDESRQMIVPAHQGNYYLLNLHVSPSPAHIAVWKHGAACGGRGWLLGKFLCIEVCDDIIDVEDNLETISWRTRKVSIKWSQVTAP